MEKVRAVSMIKTFGIIFIVFADTIDAVHKVDRDCRNGRRFKEENATDSQIASGRKSKYPLFCNTLSTLNMRS